MLTQNADFIIFAIVFIVTFVFMRWYRKHRDGNIDNFLKGVYTQLLDAAVIDPETSFKTFKEKTKDLVTVRQTEEGDIEYEFSGNIPREIVNKNIIDDNSSSTSELIHEDFEGYVNGMHFPHAVRDPVTDLVYTNLSINKSYSDAQDEVTKYQKRHSSNSETPVSFNYHILPIYNREEHDDIPDDSVWASYIHKVEPEES